MADAAVKESKGPDYGLDAPLIVRRLFSRAGWLLAVGFIVLYINHSEYPGPSDRLFLVIGGIGIVCLLLALFMIWSSRVAKPKLRDRLIDSLALKGDEKVLDVGCGRGLLLIAVAKRLKSGKATGVDVWNAEILSGNSADAVKANAKLEGVSEKVRIETGDARKLVYPESSYDVVVSSLAIHNIPDREERAQAIREMWRVLKPGGRLLIYDILRTGEYEKVLRASGASDVQLSGMEFLWAMPSRSLIAKK
jgi:SAM-dependent methyltransferase